MVGYVLRSTERPGRQTGERLPVGWAHRAPRRSSRRSTSSQEVNLFTSLWGLVLIEIAYLLPFSVLLFRGGSSATIPRELDEAAVIDGCSGSRLFFKVILPLLRPVVITVIITSSVIIYNDFQNPLYFLPGP